MRRAPDVWLNHVEKERHGYHPFEEISHAERLTEMMMMGMRLRGGVELARIESEAGQDWRMVLAQDKIQHLINENLVQLNKTHIMPTIDGMQRLNALLAYLL